MTISEMVSRTCVAKADFAIAEDRELQGRWADKIQVEGQARDLIAINVDRLTTEFLALL